MRDGSSILVANDVSGRRIMVNVRVWGRCIIQRQGSRRNVKKLTFELSLPLLSLITVRIGNMSLKSCYMASERVSQSRLGKKILSPN